MSLSACDVLFTFTPMADVVGVGNRMYVMMCDLDAPSKKDRNDGCLRMNEGSIHRSRPYVAPT